MTLISPIDILRGHPALFLTQTFKYELYDPITRMKSLKIVHVTSVGTKIVKGLGYYDVLGEVKIEHPPYEAALKYVQFQTMINNCINLAEDLKSSLLILNILILAKNNREKELIEIEDFMKLRDNLFNYLGSTRILMDRGSDRHGKTGLRS